MGFNYAVEKMKFEKRWDRLRVEYAEAGMSAESIQLMYEYDWNEFKRERVYSRHNQCGMSVSMDGKTDEEIRLMLLYRYSDQLSVPAQEYDPERRYGWIDSLELSSLLDLVLHLSKTDLELLTHWAIEGYSAAEIALLQGITPQAVHKKIRRMKKIFEKVLDEGLKMGFLSAYTVEGETTSPAAP